MSTIQVDSFAPRAGGTSFGHIGIAKAMISLRHVGGTPAVQSVEENTSSIADIGVGVCDISMTNPFASAYNPWASGPSDVSCRGFTREDSNTTTGTFRGSIKEYDTNTAADATEAVMAAWFGDLA